MVDYDDRETRHKFIAEKFRTYLEGSVLNVGGGGQKHLLKYMQPKEYIELDIDGNPDLKIDLDKEYPLPIDENYFDVVICVDVLEHLEELHRVFKEIIRITNRYVIISVPNALMIFRSYAKRDIYHGDSGTAGINVGQYTKFYGLPQVKPKDRHRWFFSYTEAEDFFHHHADVMGYRIVEEYPVGRDASSIKGKIARLAIQKLWGDDALKDCFYSVYWCILEKQHPHM